MIFISRLERPAKTSPGDDRRKDIAGGFDSIGDERIGIPNDPDTDLYQHERQIDAECENFEAKCFRAGAHAYVSTFYFLATCEAIKSFQSQSTDDSTQQRFAPTG